MNMNDLPPLINACVVGKTTWGEILKKYPVVQVSEGEEVEAETVSKSVEGATTKVEITSRGSFSRPV